MLDFEDFEEEDFNHLIESFDVEGLHSDEEDNQDEGGDVESPPSGNRGSTNDATIVSIIPTSQPSTLGQWWDRNRNQTTRRRREPFILDERNEDDGDEAEILDDIDRNIEYFDVPERDLMRRSI